jgi:poly(A) polymerase
VFRRSRLIGRRFQIVHVYCGADTIEVTTYRAASLPKEDESDEDDDSRVTAEDGMLLRDNVFGSQAEDAERRDFTVNALYYDPETEEVWEWHGGVEDAKKKVLRIIGDPIQRFREDPVRMLRAARFAAKLDFHIDPATRAPIAELASDAGTHPVCPTVRRNDEAAALRPCRARRPPTARGGPASWHSADARHHSG